MKMNLNRDELLRYVVNRVIKEDSNEETSHILWDWSCSHKLVSADVWISHSIYGYARTAWSVATLRKSRSGAKFSVLLTSKWK